MEQTPRLGETVRSRLSPWVGRKITVLDAGCGFWTPVDFGEQAYVVGLDLDEHALRRNGKLDERLVGDVETYPLPGNHFDVVLCQHVLEHLNDPDRALANMRQALKPGGWLALVFPNRWSLKGMAARLTPHAAHELGYRVLFGEGWATPYETRFAPSVSAEGIRGFATREGLRVITLEPHAGDWGHLLRQHSPILGSAWLLAERLAQVLTLGAVSPDRREFIAILADPRLEEVGSRAQRVGGGSVTPTRP
jgi:SAM-dependent methyltransferase